MRPTSTIDCDSESIKQKAQNVIKEQGDVIDRAKSLFYFVRDEIKYNMYSPLGEIEDFRASEILKENKKKLEKTREKTRDSHALYRK